MDVRQLYPQAVDTTMEALYGALDFGAGATATRPHTFLSMASTADGRAAIDGGSIEIGSEADTASIVALRRLCDAILVAGGTMAAESYERPVRDEQRRAERQAAGRAPSPLVATITRSGTVAWDVPIFHDELAEVVVFGDVDLPDGLAAQVEIVHGVSDPTEAIEHLRTEHGVKALLLEGGPSMNHALFEQGLVDELFLTIAPTIAGGADAPTIVQGPPLGTRPELELQWVLTACGDLFLRYKSIGSQA